MPDAVSDDARGDAVVDRVKRALDRVRNEKVKNGSASDCGLFDGRTGRSRMPTLDCSQDEF